MKQIINYKNLIVNPENYRFDPVSNQEEAINLMIKEKGKDILNLAKHIVDNGLDNAKDFRVLKKRESNYIVLDGNRRVTAIKCLHNPSLIRDEKLKNSFILLIKGKKIVEEVSCFVYKNEIDAAQWIKLDHTGKNDGAGQDSWGAPEKDRFSYKFEGKISPAMQMVDILEKDSGVKIDTSKLKVSTINRILSNPESRSILGIDVKKGTIEFVDKKSDVIKNTSKLFDKVIKEDVKVDEVYSKEKSIAFMNDLFSEKNKKSETELIDKTLIETKDAVSNISSRKSSPKTTSRTYLIPNSCIIEIDNTKAPKINNIYRELKNDLLLDDSLKAVPNAAGVLFRVFLEVSLDYYAEKNGGYHFKQNDTINTKITWVVSNMTTKGYDSKIFNNINKVGSSAKNQSYLSIEHFHEYVHSSTVQPTSGELKAKWDNLQVFFVTLWESLK